MLALGLALVGPECSSTSWPISLEDWDHNALFFQVDDGEKFIADSGYNGEPDECVVIKDGHSSSSKSL